MTPWCRRYYHCRTSVNKAITQVLGRFKSCSQRVGDLQWWDLWQWSRLEKNLNTFHRSTIPQKQVIIIIIIIIKREIKTETYQFAFHPSTFSNVYVYLSIYLFIFLTFSEHLIFRTFGSWCVDLSTFFC